MKKMMGASNTGRGKAKPKQEKKMGSRKRGFQTTDYAGAWLVS